MLFLVSQWVEIGLFGDIKAGGDGGLAVAGGDGGESWDRGEGCSVSRW